MYRKELERILASLQDTDFSKVGSIDLLIEYGFSLKTMMAFSSEQMVNAKRSLHKARKAAAEEVKISLAPSLMKDYIQDMCGEEAAYYELAERATRAATHTLNFIVTCISALKEQMKIENYGKV